MNSLFCRVRHHLACELLVVLACTSCGVALAALPAELPPISNPASTEHHPGKMIWADLITPNLAAAESFYAQLFGWTFQDMSTADSDYAVASLDGRPIAGVLQKAMPVGEQRQPAWLTFLAVRDVDAARGIALRQGGKSVYESKTYPRRGRQAVVADPDGAVLALLASTSGDPPDFLAAPGEWIWSSVFAHDPKRSAAFYKAVFGYDVFDLPSDDGAEHVILSSDDYARAGIHTLPPGHRRPHWLNFIRVADASESSAKAVALGGRILVEPYEDRHGGKISVIADPAGAPIGLMEWSETDSKAEPK
jgi:predicted enzyme related to lactoylglutathione lyase